MVSLVIDLKKVQAGELVKGCEIYGFLSAKHFVMWTPKLLFNYQITNHHHSSALEMSAR